MGSLQPGLVREASTPDPLLINHFKAAANGLCARANNGAADGWKHQVAEWRVYILFCGLVSQSRLTVTIISTILSIDVCFRLHINYQLAHFYKREGEWVLLFVQELVVYTQDYYQAKKEKYKKENWIMRSCTNCTSLYISLKFAAPVITAHHIQF